MSCVSEPVSWLRLERLALGELAGDDARAVREHIDACAACRSCLARIEADDRALPALPVAARAPAPKRRWWTLPRLAWSGGLLAAAAVLLFVVLRPGRDLGDRQAGDRVVAVGPTLHVKGPGDVTMSLVRERAGSITAEAATFDDGDRFEVRLTCAAAAPVFVDIVVFQPGPPPEVSFPLPPASLRCGNDVVVPGAFRITPDADGRLAPATICVALDETRAPDRAAIAAAGPRGRGLACRPLTVE